MLHRTQLELSIHKRNGQQQVNVHDVKETPTRLWQFQQTITTWWLPKDIGHHARSTIHSFANYVNLLSVQSDTRLTTYVHSDSTFTIPTIQQFNFSTKRFLQNHIRGTVYTSKHRIVVTIHPPSKRFMRKPSWNIPCVNLRSLFKIISESPNSDFEKKKNLDLPV